MSLITISILPLLLTISLTTGVRINHRQLRQSSEIPWAECGVTSPDRFCLVNFKTLFTGRTPADVPRPRCLATRDCDIMIFGQYDPSSGIVYYGVYARNDDQKKGFLFFFGISPGHYGFGPLEDIMHISERVPIAFCTSYDPSCTLWDQRCDPDDQVFTNYREKSYNNYRIYTFTSRLVLEKGPDFRVDLTTDVIKLIQDYSYDEDVREVLTVDGPLFGSDHVPSPRPPPSVAPSAPPTTTSSTTTTTTTSTTTTTTTTTTTQPPETLSPSDSTESEPETSLASDSTEVPPDTSDTIQPQTSPNDMITTTVPLPGPSLPVDTSRQPTISSTKLPTTPRGSRPTINETDQSEPRQTSAGKPVMTAIIIIVVIVVLLVLAIVTILCVRSRRSKTSETTSNSEIRSRFDPLSTYTTIQTVASGTAASGENLPSTASETKRSDIKI